MRSRLSAALVAILLACSLLAVAMPVTAETHDSACSFPVTETDATGQAVTVSERPERIVVLQPSVAQTLWELNASNRVVGAPVGPYTTYLEGINDTTDVLNADEFTVNQEAVVSLDADLVLAPNIVPDPTVERLREANQTVFKFGFGTSLEFIANKTELTGRLIGSCEAADATNENYWNRIESVREAADTRDPPRVLHYSGGPSGAATAGSGTFIDELITTAGGDNVAAENGVEGYGELNDEAIVEWNPEVIVIPDEQGELPDSAALESTFAVQNDQVVAVNGNYLSQPAPRIVLALEALADAFAAAETDATPTRTTDDSATESTPAADPADATPEEQPGFGIITALIALCCLALFRR
jgi:iron complex transport system substrate-binding protein